MTSLSCPQETSGRCRKLRIECDPGVPGCVLHGKVVFANRPDKNATPDEVARTRRRVAKRRTPPEE